MPEPIARWNRARDVWETTQAGMLCEHLGVYSETWPTSGTTRDGLAYELPTWAPRTDGSGSSLLPTPAASDGERGGPQDPEKRKAGGHSVSLQDAVHVLLPTPKTTDNHHSSPADMDRREPGLRAIARLLPTPRATDGTKGGPNQAGSSGDLMLPSAVARLLPTPTAADQHSSGGSTPGNVTLTDATVRSRLGARTNPRFDDGNGSQDGMLPIPE